MKRDAGVEDRDRRDRPEELDRREEDRRELLRVDVRPAVGLVEAVELVLERALAVERLHDGHARDRLGELRRDGSDPRSDVGERRVRAELEPARDQRSRRRDDERDEPEPPVEQEEAADRCDQREAVDDERRQTLVEDVRERVHVARQPGDDPARLLLREVAQRQRREVVEETAADLEDDLLADAAPARATSSCRAARRPR